MKLLSELGQASGVTKGAKSGARGIRARQQPQPMTTANSKLTASFLLLFFIITRTLLNDKTRKGAETVSLSRLRSHSKLSKGAWEGRSSIGFWHSCATFDSSQLNSICIVFGMLSIVYLMNLVYLHEADSGAALVSVARIGLLQPSACNKNRLSFSNFNKYFRWKINFPLSSNKAITFVPTFLSIVNQFFIFLCLQFI